MKLTKEIKADMLKKASAEAKQQGIDISDRDIKKMISEEWKYLLSVKTIVKDSFDKPSASYKLYQVLVGYFTEDKLDPTQSSGGQDGYYVSALNVKDAKAIGTKEFNRIHAKYKHDSQSVSAKIVKIPSFVQLTDSGIISL